MYLYILIGLILVLVVYVLVTYNSFVKLSNMVKEAFATMDVYLKKRWDLIPNLVESVKEYAKHEKDTLEKIVSLRNLTYDEMPQNNKIDTNKELSSELPKLMMIAENYPDLKANQNFLDLSMQLTKVEDDIANSRKYFNAVVKNLNNKVLMFPSNIIASIFGYKEIKMFETATNERESIKVEL